MLITCPSCASEYDIDPARIGTGGRKVRCAGCRESWVVTSEPPAEAAAAFSDTVLPETAAPDTAAHFTAVMSEPAGGDTVAPDVEPPLSALVPVDPSSPSSAPIIEPDTDRGPRRPASAKAKRKASARRHSDQPRRRIGGRLAAAAAALVLVATPAALLGRAKIVAALPGTASLFGTLGMPVNLVGLTFADVTSTLGRDRGGAVLEVEGVIVNPGRDPRAVPALVLVVEDAAGQPLYTWPAQAREPEIGAGQRISFAAKLATPPPEGRRVKVTFADTAPTRGAAAPGATPHGAAAHGAAVHGDGTAHEVASR